MKRIIFLILLAFWITACTTEEDEEIFDFPETSGTFIDSRDNHEYHWVKIGNQTWMAENLAYLPAIVPLKDGAVNLPCYYVYGYEGTDIDMAKTNLNYAEYGVLYNWTAALTACPEGWHLPSDAEWKQLELELGMLPCSSNECIDSFDRGTNQGTQLKSTGGWHNNGNGTNISGFSGVPAGYRFGNGNFSYLGSIVYWWSSTECSDKFAWGRGLRYNSNGISRSNYLKENGFSIRCVKN